MSALLTLVPLGYRWLALVVLALALVAFGWIKGVEFQEKRDDAKLQALQNAWDAQRSAQAKSVQDQKDRNLALQRHAEEKYTVQAQTREHFIEKTITEIRHDAAPLAACPVPEPVRVRLNAAAACARADSAASCGAGDHLSGPGRPGG